MSLELAPQQGWSSAPRNLASFRFSLKAFGKDPDGTVLNRSLIIAGPLRRDPEV
jgi:hypothetical protein